MPPRMPMGPATTTTPRLSTRVPRIAFCKPGFWTFWVVLVSRLHLRAGAALTSTLMTMASAGVMISSSAIPQRIQNTIPRTWRKRGALDSTAHRESIGADAAHHQPAGEVGDQAHDQEDQAQHRHGAQRHPGAVAERTVQLVGDRGGEGRGGAVDVDRGVGGHPDDEQHGDGLAERAP